MHRPYPFFATSCLILGAFTSAACVQDSSASGDLPEMLAQHLTFARENVSGDRAREMVAAMDPSWRLPGNSPFNAALDEVVAALEASGYVAEGPGITSPLTYRLEHRPLSRPTWEPVSASLGVVGQDQPLMTLESNINLVAANSYSTPEGGVGAEVVYSRRFPDHHR